MPSESLPPEPWQSFFADIDDALHSTTRLDCIGGFVVTQLYGLSRPTADVDVIELAPRSLNGASHASKMGRIMSFPCKYTPRILPVPLS